MDAVFECHEELEPPKLSGLRRGRGNRVSMGHGAECLSSPWIEFWFVGGFSVWRESGLTCQLTIVPALGDVLPRCVVVKWTPGFGLQPEPHE